jgi:hypothetical protein
MLLPPSYNNHVACLLRTIISGANNTFFGSLQITGGLIAHGSFEVGKPRAASNDMPNRCYLAWCLISPEEVAKLSN